MHGRNYFSTIASYYVFNLSCPERFSLIYSFLVPMMETSDSISPKKEESVFVFALVNKFAVICKSLYSIIIYIEIKIKNAIQI